MSEDYFGMTIEIKEAIVCAHCGKEPINCECENKIYVTLDLSHEPKKQTVDDGFLNLTQHVEMLERQMFAKRKQLLDKISTYNYKEGCPP